MAMKIRKGDTVMVLWGKDRGKTGVVQRVWPDEMKLIVENINIVKKHRKPRPGVTQTGIIEQPARLPIGKVALVDPSTGEPTKIGFRLLADGTKVRFAKKSGETIPDNTRSAR